MGFIAETKPEDKKEFRKIATDRMERELYHSMSILVNAEDRGEQIEIITNISLLVAQTFDYIRKLEGR